MKSKLSPILAGNKSVELCWLSEDFRVDNSCAQFLNVSFSDEWAALKIIGLA